MTRLTVLALTLLLAACAGQVEQPQYYLLRGEVQTDSRPLDPVQDYVMGSVSLAPYIDQPGLLLETADGQIRPARNHLWVEPIFESIRIYLLQQVSYDSGKDLLPASVDSKAARINVRIDQLHGTHDGEALLVAYWWVSKDGKMDRGYKFSRTRALEEDGYSALAKAQKALLAELSAEIAAAIR